MITEHHFQLPENLPPESAFVLFNLLNQMTSALWKQYETELTELFIQEDYKHYVDSQQYVDFCDGPPF